MYSFPSLQALHLLHYPPDNDHQGEPADPTNAERASSCDAEDSTIHTDPNHYGIYRTYHGNLPTHNPDDLVSLASISDSPTFGRQREQIGARPWWSGFGSSLQAVKDNYFAPFLNVTTFLLMCWFYSRSNMKSLAELDCLINEVILVKEFDRADLQGFWAAKEVECLDNYHGDPEDIHSSFSANDGWHETNVKIRVPADGVMHESLEHAPEFSVPGLFYHHPIEVIKNAFHEASAEHFHFTPFEQHYRPRKTSAFAAHHIAYIPKLSDTIQDFYCDTFSKAATAQVLMHCCHELMQAIWLLLMDDDFMHAYEFGIVIECFDGIRRHIFPRFFTYSADYHEKMLLACIKFLAQCPCPRCLTLKSKIGDLGKKVDRCRRECYVRKDSHWLWSTITMVRDWLYKKGVNITSKHVKDNLGPRSLIPTLSAFSTRLRHFGFNFYELFVPDLLREFELGVWKAVFTHLLRILYAHGEEGIIKLNWRFRQVPTFGRGTIRHFSNNASGMKCLAGRDFEDLLQCTIPVAKGTRGLTNQEHQRSGQQTSGPKVRHFNFETYKLHALGNYVAAIQKFGTSDNYLMQPFYPHVSKAKFTAGIAKQQHCEHILFKMAEGSPYEKKGKGKQDAGKQKKVLQLSSPDAPALHFEDSEPLPYSDPHSHYHISTSTRYHVNIYKWLRQHESDPTLNVNHLLSCLRGLEYDRDEREFTSAEHSTVILVHEKIFRHKVLQVNYTTYDLRRDQDSLNPWTNADIMLLAHEDDGDGHPYCEHLKSSEPQQMDFLWHPYTAGWEVKRLECIGFIPSDDPGAFGFLDPQQVIRGIHLIPAFDYGHTDALLLPSIACPTHDNNEDWTFFYINMFVDRDMMMRFRGGRVEHKSTWQATDWFLSDCDKLDKGGETNAEEEFNDGMDNMEIQDAEFDLDKGELCDAEMEDTKIEGAEQPGLDSDGEADEDEISEYGYDGIEEIEEGDEDEDEEESDNDGAEDREEGQVIDDAGLGAEDGEDDDDNDNGYAEL
ncbi:hypothetical protein BDR05DRAFT_976596 [Suillus weaverae]|nr:hypothetical protein BDR05DRAFT_976596 [Suillus weaverae]